MKSPWPAGWAVQTCCSREAQRLRTSRITFPSRFARRPPPPTHAVAMSNKRAKVDTTIVMDDVDGFTAKELFGQGTRRARPRPTPPTVQTVPTCRRPSLLSSLTPPPPTPFPRRVLHVRRRHLPPRSHQLRRRRRRSRDQAHPEHHHPHPDRLLPHGHRCVSADLPRRSFSPRAPFFFLAGAHPHSPGSPPRSLLPVQSPRRTWPSPWRPSAAPVSSTTT